MSSKKITKYIYPHFTLVYCESRMKRGKQMKGNTVVFYGEKLNTGTAE